MADRYFDRGGVSAFLKREYDPILRKMFAEKAYMLMATFQEAPADAIRGEHLEIAFEASRMPGASFGGEITPYPYPSEPSGGKFQVYPSGWVRATGMFTSQAQDDTKEGALAWISTQTGSMERTMDSAQRRAALQMYGYRYPILATVSAGEMEGVAGPYSYTEASDTLHLINADASPNAADAWTDPYCDVGSRMLLKDEYVAVVKGDMTGYRVDNAGTAVFRIGEVTNDHQVTLVGVDETANTYRDALEKGDRVVPMESFNDGTDASPDDPRGYGFYGLSEMICTTAGTTVLTNLLGDYGSLDRSGYSAMDSHVQIKTVGGLDAARALTLRDLKYAAMTRKGLGIDLEKDGVWHMHPSLFMVIAEWNEEGIRWEPWDARLGMPDEAVKVNAGGGVLKFVQDWACPPRTIFGIFPSAMMRFVNVPMQFTAVDGHVLRMNRDGTGRMRDLWEFGIHCRMQLFSPQPQSHAAVYNIGNTDPNFGMTSYLASF